MSDYQIVLWIDGVQRELHKLSLPYGCDKWYISVTSISAFSRRESTKLYENNLKGIRYTSGKRCHVKFGTDITFEEFVNKQIADKYGLVEEPLPQFHHASVWDFYKAVGYDYKKKRYI